MSFPFQTLAIFVVLFLNLKSSQTELMKDFFIDMSIFLVTILIKRKKSLFLCLCHSLTSGVPIYQLDLTKPGINPCIAASRNLFRPKPNFL